MSQGQLDSLVSGALYLVAVFVLFLIGKVVYDLLHPRYKLKTELFEKDNLALSLAVVGYYLGLVFALGGVLTGESAGLTDDLLDMALFGLLAIVLLNISAFLNDKLILSGFDNVKEIIDDKNAGTGAIEAGNHLANGLIVAGAVSGEGGGLLHTVAFWGLGQVALIVVSRIYNLTTSFDVHKEVERDNVAVGVAFAGLIVAVGNLVRFAIAGDFTSWRDDLIGFAAFLAVAVVVLPVVRLVTDKLLIPGVSLNDELVAQEVPNVGAGAIEGFSYIAASMLIGWALF